MAHIFADRVKETSTTTSTGSFALAGAVSKYVTFTSKLATNDTCFYCAVNRDAAEWEVGLGTLTGSTTLARTTVQAGTNGTSAVNFSAGTKDIFLVFPASIITNIRETLTANRTYYVRTDGSDSNTGLVSSSAGAFLTIQKAINAAAALDLRGFTVTISVADGTYTGGIAVSNPFLSGDVNIVGNTGTPANVLISHSSYAAFDITGYGARLGISGIKITNSAASSLGQGVRTSAGAILAIVGPVTFGTCTRAHIEALSASVVQVSNSYTVDGNAPNHWLVDSAYLVLSSKTITMSGTPAFATAFANFNNLASAQVFSLTKSGSATGVRYISSLNSVINTFGGGASYLHGNSAGSTATGGQYV